MGFQLHERLQADTVQIGSTDLCEVLLMNDSAWPWVVLVPRREGIREIYELPDADQVQLLKESSALGQGLMALFGGDKLNIGVLGNMVPQLHLHHIVRFEGDPAWPGPVWGKQAPVPYSTDQLAQKLDELKPVVDRLLSVR
ncbi:HIT domain-containing protein [Marinobacter zhejiangensis]|uniref:Diadenosine tetraphosphate (Ap4A) hydrolase n=1 Tax=Marinobacter zhejiangensis TaxID=488535 RepID=A0A1I4RK20_9GAMM|nr:HIT family protein [Marinobacter zhejiangensis]SFM52567.1 Diadenosine tetraphosphate (Ap4A) hydrolase [Marinobacter zhejiangensis]